MYFNPFSYHVLSYNTDINLVRYHRSKSVNYRVVSYNIILLYNILSDLHRPHNQEQNEKSL